MSLGHTKIDMRDNISYIYELKKKGKECALRRNKKFMYINAMRLRRSKEYGVLAFNTFILLGLLEASHRRDMRRHFPI